MITILSYHAVSKRFLASTFDNYKFIRFIWLVFHTKWWYKECQRFFFNITLTNKYSSRRLDSWQTIFNDFHWRTPCVFSWNRACLVPKNLSTIWSMQTPFEHCQFRYKKIKIPLRPSQCACCGCEVLKMH